jgi:hypothetical protein
VCSGESVDDQIRGSEGRLRFEGRVSRLTFSDAERECVAVGVQVEAQGSDGERRALLDGKDEAAPPSWLRRK